MLQDFKLQKFMKQSWKKQATIFYKTCVKDLNTFKYDSNIFQFMLTLYHYNRPHVLQNRGSSIKSNQTLQVDFNTMVTPMKNGVKMASLW